MADGLLISDINAQYCVAIGNCQAQIDEEVQISYRAVVVDFTQDLMRCLTKAAYKDTLKFLYRLVQANPYLKIPLEVVLRDPALVEYRQTLEDKEGTEYNKETFSRAGGHCNIDTIVAYMGRDEIYMRGDEEFDTHFIYQNSYTSKNNHTWKAKDVSFKCDKEWPVALCTHPTKNMAAFAYNLNGILFAQLLELPVKKMRTIQFSECKSPLVGMTYNSTGTLLAIYTQLFVIVYNLSSNKAKKHTFNHEKDAVICTVSFNRGRPTELCVGTTLGQIYLLDAFTGTLVLQQNIPNISFIVNLIVHNDDIIVQTLFNVICYYAAPNGVPSILKTDRVLSIEFTDRYLYVLTYDGIVSGYARNSDEYENFEIPCRFMPFNVVHPLPWYRGLMVDANDKSLTVLYPDGRMNRFTKIELNK